MSNFYTDEMIEKALEHAWGSRPVPPTFTIGRSDMIDALDAVAPLISSRAAAKALRQYADDLEDNASAEGWDHRYEFVEDVRQYATDLERGVL